MPSKGGSRAGIGARPLTDVLASVIGSAGARQAPTTAVPTAEAAATPPNDRALQRGVEIERFNELAGREDTLASEEFAELLGYRVRRALSTGRELDRLSHSWDERLVGETLDRYRRRVRRMRDLEAQGNADGQNPEAFELDPGVEERALRRMATLASQRPRGLIAGEGDAPTSRPGTERIPQLPFNPSSSDIPIYVLAPGSIPSDALAANVASLAAAGAQVSLVHRAEEVPRGDVPALVLNWGSTQPIPPGLVVLNPPESVRVAADQVESLRRLRELSPRTVLNPADIASLGTDRVVAKRRRGARGSGNALLKREAPSDATAGFDLYQEHLANRREWRLNVLSGRLTSAYLKQPAADPPADGLPTGFSYSSAREVPVTVAAVAKEASRRLGCDCAGIDVVEDLDTGRIMCFEANTAPGMSTATLQSLYTHVQQALRNGLEAAA
ncbi:MAG: hypothetical protein M3256_05895 [Actinomycetota bacterium]|nr:hypothetical protein [Actinomycetota bacterium]